VIEMTTGIKIFDDITEEQLEARKQYFANFGKIQEECAKKNAEIVKQANELLSQLTITSVEFE